MIDNHTFVDAYFTNNDRTHLKTLWKENDGNTIRPYFINIEEDPDVYKKFMNMQKITVDELDERTFQSIKSQRKQYEDLVWDIAKREELITEKSKTELWDIFAEILFEQGTDNELLFKLKLMMFEKDHVKNSEDRALKGKLRKAKTLVEVIAVYNEF